MTNDRITVSRELLRQTIDLLDDMLAPGATFSTASLRAALDQPAAEPVAWYDGRKFYATPSAAHMDCADIKALRPLYEAPQAQQPEVEPVAWLHEWADGEKIPLLHGRLDLGDDEPERVTPLFAAPHPQQPAPVQEQQPVAWVEGRWYEDGTRAGNTLVWASRTAEDDFPVGTNLYTAQPRKAVKLTGEEVGMLTVFDGLHHVETPLLAEFIRAIEQAVLKANGVCE